MGLITVFILATSTAGFVLSMGTYQPATFQYQGTCTGVVKKIRDTRWLVYTLKDLNIPGTRKGSYIETVPTRDVRSIVLENNLLYWKNAVVNVFVKDRNYTIEAFVLGNRRPGDEVLLDCYLNVEAGRPTYSSAIEIPE